MQKELNKIIQEHLPAMAAKEMKVFIENAESVESELHKLKSTHKTTQQLWTEQTEKNYVLERENKDWKKRSEDIITKEKMLDELEVNLRDKDRNMDLHQAQYELQEANKRADGLFQLTETVFKNPIVKRTVHSNEQVPTNTQYESQWDSNAGKQVETSTVTQHGNKEETTTTEVE